MTILYVGIEGIFELDTKENKLEKRDVLERFNYEKKLAPNIVKNDKGILIDEFLEVLNDYANKEGLIIKDLVYPYKKETRFSVEKSYEKAIFINDNLLYRLIQSSDGSDYPDSGADSTDHSRLTTNDGVEIADSWVNDGFNCYSGGGVPYPFDRRGSRLDLRFKVAQLLYEEILKIGNPEFD